MAVRTRRGAYSDAVEGTGARPPRTVITVVDYDPAWPERFEVLRGEYARALDAAGVPVVSIEHVGSTSVPGLAAKPIIDCDIVVGEVAVPAASAVLEDLGFSPLGELGIERRWAFREPERLRGTNTYVVVDGSLALHNHRCVRDTLRADPALRDAYAHAKRAAAAAALDIDDYGQRKSPVIQRILAAGGLTAEQLAVINAAQVPSHQDLPR